MYKFKALSPISTFVAFSGIVAAGGVQTAMANTIEVSTSGAPVVSIDTVNGTPASTIQLNANTVSGLSTPGTFNQMVYFYSGYDGTAGPVPFSLVENVT